MALSFEDANHELRNALAGPENDVFYDVVEIAERLLRSGHSDDELRNWSAIAAHGFLARDIPLDKLIWNDALDARLSALTFCIADTELIKLWPGSPLPNLRAVSLGEAEADWTVMPDCNWRLLQRVYVFPGPGLAKGLLGWLARQELPVLRRLHMSGIDATRADFAALTHARYWAELEEVDVGFNREFSGPWPALPAARTIKIPNTSATNDDLRTLLSVALPQLAHLDISGNHIDNVGFDALLARSLPALTTLAARGCDFAEGHAWRGLARAGWPSLRHLDLQDTLRDPRVLATAAPVLRGLTKLEIGSCDLDDAGAAVLAAVDMPELEHLDVTYNQLTDVGMAQLATAKWPRLKHLNIAVNPIGDRGVAALVRASWWESLEHVDLVRGELTDVGLRTLAGAIPRTLRQLRVGPAKWFGSEAYEVLRRALPEGASL